MVCVGEDVVVSVVVCVVVECKVSNRKGERGKRERKS